MIENIYNSVIVEGYDVCHTQFNKLYTIFKEKQQNDLIREALTQISTNDLIDLIVNFDDHVHNNYYDNDLPIAIKLARRHVLICFLNTHTS